MDHSQEWDNYATIYEKKQRSGRDENVNLIVPSLLRKIPDNLKGSRVLDLCCGRGILTKFLLERGAYVYAVDGSEKLLKQARAALRGNESVVFEQQDVCKLRVPQEPFDFIVSNMALQDVYDAGRLIASLAKASHHQTNVLVSFRHPFTDGWQGNYLEEQTARHHLQEEWQSFSPSEFYPKRYHRSLTAYISYFLKAGFNIVGFEEIVSVSSDPVLLIAVIIEAQLASHHRPNETTSSSGGAAL